MLYTALPATADHLPELVRLMDAFYAESSYALDHAWARRSFATLLRKPDLGMAWLLRHGNAAVGHIVLTLRFSMEFGGIDAFVDDLYVDSAHRRRGAGSMALGALIAECGARGVLALHVEVEPDNAAARALYSTWGLQPRSDARITLTRRFDPTPS